MKSSTSAPTQNRTGTEMAPQAANVMLAYAETHSPTPDVTPDSMAIAAVRCDYVMEAGTIGSMPPQKSGPSFSSMGSNAEAVLLDKLGERLAFERSGVRLYQALIDKAATLENDSQLPFELSELEHIRDEELLHMQWVDGAIKTLGADSTAQTPCADVVGVAASGIMQVLSDPRTDIAQCLTALLTAEMADAAGWSLLIELTDQVGHSELLANFREAEQHELEHLAKVRSWLTEGILEQIH